MRQTSTGSTAFLLCPPALLRRRAINLSLHSDGYSQPRRPVWRTLQRADRPTPLQPLSQLLSIRTPILIHDENIRSARAHRRESLPSFDRTVWASNSSIVLGQSLLSKREKDRSLNTAPSNWRSSPRLHRRCAAPSTRSPYKIRHKRALEMRRERPVDQSMSLGRSAQIDTGAPTPPHSNGTSSEMAIVERHVQDLIRIGVADAAQHTWIRQDPLQRMVFAGEAHAEILLCAVQRL